MNISDLKQKVSSTLLHGHWNKFKKKLSPKISSTQLDLTNDVISNQEFGLKNNFLVSKNKCLHTHCNLLLYFLHHKVNKKISQLKHSSVTTTHSVHLTFLANMHRVMDEIYTDIRQNEKEPKSYRSFKDNLLSLQKGCVLCYECIRKLEILAMFY